MTEPTDAELLAEWGRVSHIADAGQRRLACLRAVLAKWGMLRSDRIVIPTDTMEQEFQKHYQRGYEAGKKAATQQPTQAADSVTAPAGGADWQDISTAPKDGTRFVAVGQNYGLDSEAQHACIAQWLAGCWVEVSDWNGASKLKYLTHWMPLLPLPGNAARKQGGGT